MINIYNIKRLRLIVVIWLLVLGTFGLGSGQDKIIQTVNYSKLIPFLPESPPGWIGEESKGTTFTTNNVSWNLATKVYSKSDNENLETDVGIMDSEFQLVGWWKAWRGFYEWESTEGYSKKIQVKGFPAWEIYDINSNKYNLFVNINDRFLVNIDTNSDKEAAYSYANSINYSGIAALEYEPSTEKPDGKAPGNPKSVQGFEVIFVFTGFLAMTYLLKWRK